MSTETRELLIRTSLEWRMQKLWEKLRLYCFVVKRKLTREKPFVWDEESKKAAEELDDGLDEEEPFAFTGPDFNPAVTAFFNGLCAPAAPYQPTCYPQDTPKGTNRLQGSD